MRKKEDDSISLFSEIQDVVGSPEAKTNLKQVDNIEKKTRLKNITRKKIKRF
jgi:hypothetical protein